MLYKKTWRRQEYREKRHKTGEGEEWKLDASITNRENAEEDETVL